MPPFSKDGTFKYPTFNARGLVSPFELGKDGAAEVASSAPNRLSLSDGAQILFLAEWKQAGPIRVVTFERGAWEGKLLARPREA